MEFESIILHISICAREHSEVPTELDSSFFLSISLKKLLNRYWKDTLPPYFAALEELCYYLEHGKKEQINST